MRKSKQHIFKMNMTNLLEEFYISVERANIARISTQSDKPVIELTFENFIKWMTYNKSKKIKDKMKELEDKGVIPKKEK